MALTTIGPVWDRIVTLVEAQGYVRAQQPFSFDQQPDSKLDYTFYMTSDRQATFGYVGGDQGEEHKFEIFLAQRAKRDAWGAARQLKVDMDLIEQTVKSDGAVYDYHLVDDGVSTELPPPALTDDFVIGKLDLIVEFDRMM